MSIITEAIYDKLVNDSTLTADLSVYRGSPAVFTRDPVPEDVELPYIVTAGEVGQSPFDTKTSRGRDVVRDVRCFAEATGSPILIERIAERVRFLLHRQTLNPSGYHMIFSLVSGPTVNDGEGVYGRVISLRWVGMQDA